MNALKVIAGITAVFGAIFCIAYFGLSMDRFFAPKQEALRRHVFEQSQSYNDGMKRDLDNIHMQYMEATPEGKQALRSIAIHRFSVYNESELSDSQMAFYNSLRNSQ